MTDLDERRASTLPVLARPSDEPVETSGHQPGWTRRYRALLGVTDGLAITAAIGLGYAVRFADTQPTIGYGWLCIGMLAGWLITLLGNGAYDVHHLATFPTEARCVLRATMISTGILAVYCYATRTEVARGFVVGVIPAGVALVLFGRMLVRAYVYRRRDRGAWSHRILAIGTSDSVRHLLDVTERAAGAGLRIVGCCVEDAEVGSRLHGIPVVGGVREAAVLAPTIDADVVAVTGSGLGPTSVRQLGWQLEGTGIGLVMAPSLTEIAGPRVHVSPVEGLPLVWLERPQLGRIPRVIKRAVDLLGGAILTLIALPLLVLAAVAVKLDSRGPVFFRQQRLGQGGAEFSILKLRTMRNGAHAAREHIVEMNEQDGGGVLFKIREDPRITRVGKFLRRYSIDELPQLFHVLSGRMSLVGPRPLAAEDSIYTGDARRRLLVRPGVTGLWQVSGRSDVSWDDAVRLDLYYVENWSLGMDLGILARTVLAVLRRKGAY